MPTGLWELYLASGGQADRGGAPSIRPESQGVGMDQGCGARRSKSELGLHHSGDLGATLDKPLPFLRHQIPPAVTFKASVFLPGVTPRSLLGFSAPPASLAASFLGAGCVHLPRRAYERHGPQPESLTEAAFLSKSSLKGSFALEGKAPSGSIAPNSHQVGLCCGSDTHTCEHAHAHAHNRPAFCSPATEGSPPGHPPLLWCTNPWNPPRP